MVDYIDPVLSSGLFGNLRNVDLPFSGTVSATPIPTPTPTPTPEAKPFPWWLVVFGIFAVLALSEPQRG